MTHFITLWLGWARTAPFDPEIFPKAKTLYRKHIYGRSTVFPNGQPGTGTYMLMHVRTVTASSCCHDFSSVHHQICLFMPFISVLFLQKAHQGSFVYDPFVGTGKRPSLSASLPFNASVYLPACLPACLHIDCSPYIHVYAICGFVRTIFRYSSG